MKLAFLITIVLLCFNCKPKNDQEVADFFLKANLLSAKKEYKSAVLMYLEALEKKPDFVDAMNNLGLVYQKQGKTEEALVQFEKALSLEPTFTMAIYNRAESLYASKNFKACIADLNEVKKVYIDSFFVYQSLGNVYFATGYKDKALENYKISLSKNKNATQTFINRGVLYFDNEDLKNAKNDFEKALTIEPANDFALNNLALILIEEQNFGLALNTIEKALTLKPADPIYINNKGLIYLKTNQLKQGLELIEKSLRIMPDNANAIKNKGLYYLESKQYEAAKAQFLSAKAKDPSLRDIDLLIKSTRQKKL